MLYKNTMKEKRKLFQCFVIIESFQIICCNEQLLKFEDNRSIPNWFDNGRTRILQGSD